MFDFNRYIPEGSFVVNSFARGVILSVVTGAVGLVVLNFPPKNLPETGMNFWIFLSYVWLFLSVTLLASFFVTSFTRIGVNIPLAIALLFGGSVALNTFFLAQRAGGILPMVASIFWLVLFILIGSIELVKRSQRLTT